MAKPESGPPPASDDAAEEDSPTLLLSGAVDGGVLVRYRLRSVSHRLASDCERLLAEVDGPAREAWQLAVGKALLAAQRLRSLGEQTRSLESAPTDATGLDRVAASIRTHQQTVIDAMSTLLALIPTDTEERLIMEDARAIRDAAIGLFATDDAANTGSARASASPATAPAQASVLVVDDEAALRQVLALTLKRLGHKVTTAEDGREALERAEQDLPDLIITDLTMPHMTGHELLARLKAGERTQHIPVIVVSGEGDSASVVKCLELGAEDHLTKPYEPVVLQARIRTTLERKRMRDHEMAYLRRVGQLTSAAEAVERQSYDSGMLADIVTESDQLGQLARVFDRMMHAVRTREEQLEARVRQLRNEMGHVSKPSLARVSQAGNLVIGHVLAERYEITRELGNGGMGVVYEARDRELGEDVAIKVVRRDVISQDPTLLERLKSEMRLARRISHRNVVRSHDLGEWKGMYYLTMEYIKGITVADLIETRGRLGVDATIAIGTQLADALTVAHAAGVIHRDIKPENLLVDEGGVLKVTDFGLARPVQRSDGMTKTGYVVGTPRFMAPEQLLGDTLDERTDLFAVGLVLYVCLTGRNPFEADTPTGAIAKMLDGSPQSVRELEPSVPPGLAAAVEKLLQRDPAKRFQSARELANHLAQIS